MSSKKTASMYPLYKTYLNANRVRKAAAARLKKNRNKIGYLQKFLDADLKCSKALNAWNKSQTSCKC